MAWEVIFSQEFLQKYNYTISKVTVIQQGLLGAICIVLVGQFIIIVNLTLWQV